MSEEERAAALDRLAALDSSIPGGVRRVLEEEEEREPESEEMNA